MVVPVTRPVFSAAAVAALTLGFAPHALAADACFERLDNGVDLTGWHPSTTNHHGPGDNWLVEDGAMVGKQKPGQLGGILMTDKSYSDVEIVLEVKIDWGCDSGLFLRTTAGDRAYQACVDHLLPSSSVGSIYGEGFAGGLLVMPYTLDDGGNKAVQVAGQTPLFDLNQWPSIWHPTEFNEMRVRMEGNPPHMQIWLSGTKVADYTDSKVRGDVDAAGPLAIQVHGGSRWTADGKVRYRNIRVRDLTKDCVEPNGPGTGGQGGQGGATQGGSAGTEAAGGSPGVGGAPSGAASSAGAATASGGGAVSMAPTSAAGMAGSAAVPTNEAAVSSDEGGCSIASSRSRSRGGAAWLLLLGLAAAGRRLTRRRVSA